MSDGITVRGTGQAARTPDSARVSIGVDAQARAAGEAQAEASARSRAVLAALREAGVEERDLATQRVSLEPAYDYSGNTPRMTGYGASQVVSVRVRRLDDLGQLIDRAVAAGATHVAEVTLELAEPGPALAEARELAMADARSKAEALARAAGVTLGKAISIVEGVRVIDGPRPMFKARAEMMAAADTPIAAGSTELCAEVEVTFAILG